MASTVRKVTYEVPPTIYVISVGAAAVTTRGPSAESAHGKAVTIRLKTDVAIVSPMPLIILPVTVIT
jgi:hypothetical protein